MFENSLAATEAAECALEQGASPFEALNERLWTDQASWKGSNDPEPVLRGMAQEAGVNLSEFDACLRNDTHIDRIAAAGMKFTRGYATCQVCSPSRASILTGKYPPNHGITTWIGDASGKSWSGRGRHDSHLPTEYDRNLRASEITLAEVLRENGYRTFFAGKWHLGSKGSWPT